MTLGQPANSGADGAPPVCYRHPDRVAYVRCQRCGRPICPECQRPAAVGVQCPECVRNAEKRISPARSVLGAPMGNGKPVVTITIIAICAVIWIIQLVAPTAVNELVFVPAWSKAEPWTYLTTSFLHGSWAHILFNMYALWVVGSNLEQVLGRACYIALYLVSCLGGSVMILMVAQPSLTQNSAWITGTVGASSGIYGLFAAIVWVTKRLRQDMQGILIVIGINVVFTLVMAGVSWQGHLGGFVTGLALGAGYAYAPRDRRRLVTVATTAVVLVILVALVAWKYAIVPANYFA